MTATAVIPTVGAAATPAAASTAALKTTAPAIPTLHGTGFVDHDLPAADIRAIERGDRVLRILIAGHFNETKALGTPGIAIGDHAHRFDSARLSKKLTQTGFRSREGEIPHIKFLSHKTS